MAITEATVKYVGTNGIMSQVPLVMLNKKTNPRNFNKIRSVRYVAPAFAYMMSLHVFYSDKAGSYIYKTTDADYATVIISDAQLAENIGCSERQAARVMNTLQQIFDLKYERLHEIHGARKVTITNRVIQFLKIFTLQEFYSYIEKYQIESKYMKAMGQLYDYRAWGVKPRWLSPQQRQARTRYINDHQDFFHQVHTNNVSDQQRINTVNSNRDQISEYNNKQLDRIIEEKQKGRLSSYWFKLLIRLEQLVTYAKKKLQDALKSKQETTTPIDNESNQGVTVAHASATQKAQRIPEEYDPAYIAKVFVNWNNMTRGTNIPNIGAVSQNDIHVIDTMVNSIGKETLLDNIWKVTALDSVSNGTYKMTFKRFMTNKTMEIFETNNITKDIDCPWLIDEFVNDTGLVVHDRIEITDIPTFNTTRDVITWWNNTVTK